MTCKDIGRELSRQLIAALESPATCDRNGLLTAAAAFLDIAEGRDLDGLPLARTMAHRAADWAVLDTQEGYKKLERAAAIFLMATTPPPQ
jgi:hypothetical protein